MYKPHTIEQFKIVRFLKEQGFVMERFILSPLSRTALLVEDSVGDQLAFCFENDAVVETPIPTPAGKAEVLAFIQRFREDPDRPTFRDFEEITAWWHNTPNPLSYQQALSLPDDLYRHFLTHAAYDEEDVRQLVAYTKKDGETKDKLLKVTLDNWGYVPVSRTSASPSHPPKDQPASPPPSDVLPSAGKIDGDREALPD